MSGTIRKVRKSNFTTVNNDYLQDSGLSWKAKGIITYIMSLPENWRINISDLKNRSKDGRDSTSAGIAELIEKGYCNRKKVRDNDGLFLGYDYDVSDQKDFYPLTENPLTDNQNTENPFPENPTVVNTNNNKDPFIVNTNGMNPEPMVQSLFPDSDKASGLKKKEIAEEKALKTLFCNSAVFKLVKMDVAPPDYSEFEKCFPGDDYKMIDLVYYFHSVSDWSDQKNEKRTKAGWLATVRNFIRGDIEKKRLKLKPEFKPETQKIIKSDALEYLKDDY